MPNISPCLWFDSEAEEAANFYISIFKNSKILRTTYYGKAGFEVHGQAAGTVLTVVFELDGQEFTALNGGPVFRFNEAVSLQVFCQTQDELDYFWTKLSEGGDSAAQQCGWLKDRYGVSWQIVPRVMGELFTDSDVRRRDAVMSELLKMKKIDIETLKNAYTLA